MKKITLCFSIVIICNCTSITQWILQHNNVTTLYDIQFVNNLTGWSIGVNSVILKTTNGGGNWINQQSNLSAGKNLIGLSMINENTGYISGWFETIVKTTNGGVNWVVISDGPIGQRNSWNSSFFLNDQTGWICGFLGVIKRTTNGGISWDSLNTGNSTPLREIEFINSQTGWVAGDGGYLRKTTNGGTNWSLQITGTTADFWYNSLQFINNNSGWVVGYDNIIYSTTNSGSNWDTLSTLPGICVHFANALTGWVGGNAGAVYKTTNGGTIWLQQNNPVSSFITSFYFYSDSLGWASVGGRIINTTNGGTYVAVEAVSNNLPVEYKLFQNYPNPFNNETTLEFSIMKAGLIRLEIFNSIGQRIDTIIEQQLNPGKYKINWEADKYSSGYYFCRLSVNKYTETKIIILNK